MSDTTLTELRKSLDYMKEQSGAGSKQRKQDEFERIYTADVGHLVAGERYDDAGIGPATAREAAEQAFGELPDGATLSESIAELDDVPGTNDSARDLVESLDQLAELSGNEQKSYLVENLLAYTEPSIITVALLDDESFGLGTSQMREIWFDGSRDERKRTESLVEGTVEFITRAKNGTLPDGPQPMEPFDPMLAKAEDKADEPDNCVAQVKVDGYRLLVHTIDGQARAYTRNRKDVTHSLPELNEISWPEGDYIIDCEVIAEDGTYASTSSRVGKKAENIEREQEMEFACFDIVHANGDWTEKPYKQRYEKLQALVQETIPDPTIYALEASSNIDAVKDYALEQGFEGVILKDLYHEYELGTRSSAWVKQKHMAQTVDVVAADFEEGEGRLDGTLGKIVLESADGEPIGRTGSGFTDEERDEIWNNKDEYRGGALEVEGEAFDDGIRFPIFKRWRIDDGEPDSIDRIRDILPKA